MNDSINYADLYKSLIRFCTQVGSEISLITNQAVTFTAFDGIGDIGTLPSGDLIGFSDLQVMTQSEEIGFRVEVMLILSVTEDTHLMRLETQMADYLSRVTREQDVIVIYKEDAGLLQAQANLVFNGDRLIASPTRDGSRTFKAFRCNLLCDKRLA